MAKPVLSDIPDKITAGDSVAWKRTLADYPAGDGWTLSYALAKTGVQITFDGSADGNDHLIQIPAATTAQWAPGQYAFQAYAGDGTDRVQVDEGLIEIRPDLQAQTTGYDALPFWFKVRDALEAALTERASETQLSIAVGGQQISEMSPEEMMTNKEHAEKQCNLWMRRNRRQRGRATGARVKVAFTDN